MKLLWLIWLGLYQILNYSITEFALKDVFSPEIHHWAMLLSICFCLIDFSPISLVFRDKETANNNHWYFLGAWILASAMNATLHWWTLVISSEYPLGLEKIIPVSVTLLLFIARIIIVAGFISTWSKK